MKNLVRAVCVSVVLLPVLASAQTNSITDQAQALLQQILLLQQQLGVSGGATVTSGSCTAPAKTLKLGTSGADVTLLQQMLARDPSVYPEGKVTGYYGALTQSAVQRWQAKNGIVSSGSPSTTGYGSVGPRTLAAMQAACSGAGGGSQDPVVGGFIKVSPVSGDAPLLVTVEATINSVKSCLPATYTLSWGDGSAPISISVPANVCNVLAQTYTHTYNQPGAYSIALSSGAHQSTSIVNVGGISSGSSSTGGNAPTGGSASTGGTNQDSGSATVVSSGALAISMSGNSFSPNNVTVTSGTRVTWTNTDSQNHTVSADNASFNSGTLAPGQTYSVTLTAKGEYTYFCAFHGSPGSGMTGKITVQ